MESTDVLVLGLGPAGAAAAAAAARRGCKVVAFDRKRTAGLPVQCAEFVPAMIGIDVVDLAGSVRQRIEAMTTFVEDDAPDLKPNFPGHMLDREAFDTALVSTAMQAGAQCRFASCVRKVSSGGLVELSDGHALCARVIVGADGPRSIAPCAADGSYRLLPLEKLRCAAAGLLTRSIGNELL